MVEMKAAFYIESLKLARSLVGIVATFVIVFGVICLLGGITAGIVTGNPDLIRKAGTAATLDWSGLLSAATQISTVSMLLGFGIVLAWIFGREFSDHTVTALFALPISLTRIALAKFAVYLTWAFTVSNAVLLVVFALGSLIGYGVPDADAWAAFGRLWVLLMFSIVLVTPVAWIVTLTRSLLAGVASTIVLIVLAQIGILAGIGGWVPPAVPALWALSAGTAVSLLQLAFTAGFAAGFAFLVCWSWKHLELDR